MSENTTEKCCICGVTFVGCGNNPWPLKEEGRCCDDCNQKVVEARIRRLIYKED